MWKRDGVREGRGQYSYLGGGCDHTATMPIWRCTYMVDVDPEMHEAKCNVLHSLIPLRA